MDTKKALLTIIIILAFALIVTSLGQLTGYTITNPTTITISPPSVLPGDKITITVNPGQKIKDQINVYKLPSDTRVAVKDLDCMGFCSKDEMGSTTMTLSLSEQPGKYVVRAYDPKGNVIGSGYYEVV